MALVDGEVDLEVVIPTITIRGDVVEDVEGISSTIVWEEVAAEEALTVGSHDVVFISVMLGKVVGGRT